MALLRLEGRFAGRPPGEVSLVVEGPEGPTTVTPLPDPDPPREVWRAAFPLPFDQAQRPGLRYRLVDAAGSPLRELSWPDSTEEAPEGPGRRELRALRRERDQARKALAKEEARGNNRVRELERRVEALAAEGRERAAEAERELEAVRKALEEDAARAEGLQRER